MLLQGVCWVARALPRMRMLEEATLPMCSRSLSHALSHGLGVSFFSYYTPCYLAISATSLLLKAFPAKVPKFVSSGLGCVLTTVASIWSALPHTHTLTHSNHMRAGERQKMLHAT